MSLYSPEQFEQTNRELLTYNQVVSAIHNKQIIEVKVSKCNSHNNLTLNIGNGITGTVRFEDIEYRPDGSSIKVASATSKVGKYIKVIPLSITETNGNYLVKCSRKECQRLCYENFISKLVPGDVIDACFVKATGYGAFCDIGCGIIGFLYTNNISITHTIDPVSELGNITKMKVVIKSIDENYRIELSHKELLGTWEEEVENIEEGDVINGLVLSVEEYGTFIRISQNLSGLADVDDKFKLHTGDSVAVRVLKINSKNMKIKLSVINVINNDDKYTTSFNYRETPSHIDKWVYSTPTSRKIVETSFGD